MHIDTHNNLQNVNNIDMEYDNINLLIVDDDSFNRLLIKSLFDKKSNKHIHVYEAEEGREGLDILNQENIDVILLDLHMPGMNGYAFLEAIKRHKQNFEDLVVIAITTDIDEKEHLISAGADDLIAKPFKLDILESKIYKYLKKKRKSITNQCITERESATPCASCKAVDIGKIEEAQRKMFYRMSVLRFASKPSKYIERQVSAHIAKDMAYKMGFTPNQAKNIHCSTVIRDIGLISLPSIFSHKRRLSDDAKRKIKEYILKGSNLFDSAIETNFTQSAKQIILEYKERYDGKGTPRGLKGDEICKEATIVSIADMFEGLLNNRSYRQKSSFTPNEAYEIFKSEKYKKFHPNVLDIFLENYDYYMNIKNIYNSKFQERLDRLI